MKSQTSTRIAAATASLLVAALAAPAPSLAAPTNGDFAAGLAGWSGTGNVAVDTISQFGPPQAPASAQAVMGTAETSGFLFGGAAVAPATLEASLGLTPGTLSGLGAFDGSGLSQTFNANAGERLRFDWKLMTNEPQNAAANDLAFAVIDGSLVKLASVQTAVLLGSSLSPMLDETAYTGFVSAPLASGAHAIAFGIVDVPDGLGASALAVTNVSTVPEPTTNALLLGGLAVLLPLLRRIGTRPGPPPQARAS